MTSRIDLTKTKYKTIDFKLLSSNEFTECEQIYKQYIRYKNFEEIKNIPKLRIGIVTNKI